MNIFKIYWNYVVDFVYGVGYYLRDWFKISINSTIAPYFKLNSFLVWECGIQKSLFFSSCKEFFVPSLVDISDDPLHWKKVY